MQNIEKLKPFINGKFVESETIKYNDILNPSTGDVIAKMPCLTKGEIEGAIEAADNAFHLWANTPVMKRVQVLYRFRDLLIKNLDELTLTVARENGKVLSEAKGDILKVKEALELACGVPSLMMGESLMDTSSGYDTVLYREPLGVFAGIVPFNFPGMIPMGWMTPLCIATGNTIVVKASPITPMTALKCAKLWKEAGLPDGVVNVVTCEKEEAQLLLSHKHIKGVSFVGSTKVGLNIYSEAARNGKRVQALCEAKNHGLVLEDAVLERTAEGIINSSFGCAGERCMALPVVVAQESIADKLVEMLVKKASKIKVGPAYDEASKLGPVISKKHKESVLSWINKGIEEGATLALDGRDKVVEGFEGGFYIGPTILDNVTSEMTVGDKEIFGPVLCVKRVRDFEEGLQIMNNNKYANGAVIFTQNGYYAREFSKRSHGGMVGVNVGIPVPVSVFPFNGHKNSFFGDAHVLGKDGVRFYTESKTVTTKWFNDDDLNKKVDTWDGSVGGS